VSSLSLPEIAPAKPREVTLAGSSRERLASMFHAHHDFIWRLLRRLGLSHEKADDAAQRVFLVAAERLEVIRLGSERAFLFGTALRVARMSLRTERRWVLEEDMDVRLSLAPKTEELAERSRAIDLMDQVLARMELDLRTVFILFEIEGLTTPEIAGLIEIPLGTAASRLRRAREAFQSILVTVQRPAREESA
jgi:RNA polymerase sigma-70 factor (ECF subfamily)